MALSEQKVEKLQQEFGGDELLQYERKRWGFFGLPFTFTKYYLTDKKVVIRTGLLNFKEDEILLYRILDTRIQLGLFQRLFGLGTLELITSDKTHSTLQIKNIKNVREFKNTLASYVEQEKLRMRFRTGEIVDHEADCDCDAAADDMFDGENY